MTMTKRETMEYLLKTYGEDENVVWFANHELELLQRKAERAKGRLTKGQILNEEIKTQILGFLSVDTQKGLAELSKDFDGKYSREKLSALASQLVKAGKIERFLGTTRNSYVQYSLTKGDN